MALTQDEEVFQQGPLDATREERPDRVEAYLERCCHGRAEESCKELEHAGVAQSTPCRLDCPCSSANGPRRRLLKGETIAHDEKVFSIFEEHTRWVSRVAGCAVELDPYAWLKTRHHKILWEGTIPILRCRSSTRRGHFATYGCAASTVGSTAPATGRNSTQCSPQCATAQGSAFSGRARARSASICRPRRSSRCHNLEQRVRSHVPMGLRHRCIVESGRQPAPHRFCLCDMREARRRRAPRSAPPGPAHGDERPVPGSREFHPSVVSVRPVPWPKPRESVGSSHARKWGFSGSSHHAPR